MAQTPDEILKEAQESAEILKDSFISLGAQIRANLNTNLAGADAATKQLIKKVKFDLTAAVNGLGKSSEKFLENQLKINKGQLTSKDIAKQLVDLEYKGLKLANDMLIAKKNGLISDIDADKIHSELIQKMEEERQKLTEQSKQVLKIEENMGNLGKIVKGLNKIPILGGLIDSEKVLEDIQGAAAKQGANRFTTLNAGLSSLGKSITKNLVDPLTLTLFFFNQILKANKQTVELGKALGKDSYEYRENLASVARSTNNVNITAENLVGAFNELAQATGFAYEYTSDQLITQTKLTKQVGLQADEAAQIQRLGILNNKTSESTYNSFVKGLVATRNQLKVGINFKATLAEATKVSGQLAANLGYNPERIAKAIVTAKAFGMTLDQVAKSGESLLNFESSIESELKAELITGKQINLERARMAALTGDQVALAEELSNQIGTSADFTKMNVIQQKSLAESVGMTTDELAESLRKREEAIRSGKSLAQITEDEAKQAIERQTIQDKFNNAVLKLQDVVGNLVAGPIGQFVSYLAQGLDYITGIAAVFGTILLVQKGIAAYQQIIAVAKGKELAVQLGIAAAWAIANPFTALAGLAIAGGIAAFVASQMKDTPKFAAGGIVTSEINNATIGEAGPEAIIPLNSPKADNILGGSNPRLEGLVENLINVNKEVKASVDRLYNKDTSIKMDSNKVGSTLVQNSYKLA